MCFLKSLSLHRKNFTNFAVESHVDDPLKSGVYNYEKNALYSKNVLSSISYYLLLDPISYGSSTVVSSRVLTMIR
jgi:hypothetical protein